MALSLYKDPENNPGEKVFLRSDPETGDPIYGMVRQVTPEKLRELQRPFERPHKRKGRQTVWKVPKKNQDAFSAAILDWAWRDIVGYEVRMPDAETAGVFSSELGGQVQKGDVVKLDGRLTPSLKQLIADSDLEINRSLNDAMGLSTSDEDEQEEDDVAREREEFMRGNLQSGSNSESGIATSPSLGAVEPESEPQHASSSVVGPKPAYPRTS